MEPQQLTDVAAAVLARRNINPDRELEALPPFDAKVWRMSMVREALTDTIPEMYQGAEPSNPAVAEWVATTLAGASTRSILLTGTIGTGKTHQAYGALRRLALGAVENGQRWTWASITHAELNRANRPGGNGFEQYLDVDILLLDDLGATNVTAWNADAMYQLVDHRYTFLLPTIFTTNFGPDDLTESLGARLTSRLFGMTNRIKLSGPDRRMA